MSQFFAVVGRKSDQEILAAQSTGRLRTEAEVRDEAVLAFGGVESDYSALVGQDSQAADRLDKDKAFIPTWDGAAPAGELTAITFATFGILGRKSDQMLMRAEVRNNFPSRDQLLQSAADQMGGVPGDYSLFLGSDPNIEARLRAQDEFTLSWDAAAPGGEIDGLSFSVEDNKRWLRCRVGPTFDAQTGVVEANNTDSINVRFEVLSADRSGVDTNVTNSELFSIETPNGIVPLFIQITNGVQDLVLQTPRGGAGLWRFPAPYVRKNVRTDPVLDIAEVTAYITDL